jgi:hypothetical protein
VFLPLFTDPFYVGSTQPLWRRFFGISLATWTVFMAPSLSLAACVSAQMISFVFSLSRSQLEAAFDELLPEIAELGIRRFVTLSAVSQPLAITSDALTRFNQAWNKGVRHHTHVVKELLWIWYATVVSMLVGLCIPSVLLMSHSTVHINPWSNPLRVIGMWCYSIYCFNSFLRRAADDHA